MLAAQCVYSSDFGNLISCYGRYTTFFAGSTETWVLQLHRARCSHKHLYPPTSEGTSTHDARASSTDLLSLLPSLALSARRRLHLLNPTRHSR